MYVRSYSLFQNMLFFISIYKHEGPKIKRYFCDKDTIYSNVTFDLIFMRHETQRFHLKFLFLL